MNHPFRTTSFGFLSALLFFFQVFSAAALTPIDDYNSLVAGGDDAGYQDGTFAQARFNHPSGLAFDDKGSRLFVADRGNHRIRVIYLDEQNRAETLAGTGAVGKDDGPLDKATFNQPSALAFIPPDRLAVYDEGNQLLRLIDLQAKSVDTLGKTADGKTPAEPLGIIWNLAYRPKDDSLYFSQPADHLLRRMELKPQKISTVLSNDARMPSPKALCVGGSKLYAADQEGTTVFEVKPIPGGSAGQGAVSLVEAGKGDHVVELAESDGILYALQSGDVPLARVALGYQPVSLATPWGFLMDNKNTGANPFLQFDPTRPSGFSASPRNRRELFISGPAWFSSAVPDSVPDSHAIVSVKDYEFDKYWGARSLTEFGVLSDFKYPEDKPAKTFRILVVGNSRVVTGPSIVPEAGKNGLGIDVNGQGLNSLRTNTFPKQLELLLNVEAALQGSDRHFEVLTIGRPGAHLPFFANQEVPGFAKKYHVDLVLAFVASFEVEGFRDYYEKPMSFEGIPSNKVNPEFLLKPWKEKIPSGAPARLFARCKEKGWARVASPTQLDFPFFCDLLGTGDKEVRDDLIEMLGRPLRLLAGKMRSLQKDGKDAPQFMVCYAPSRDNGGLNAEVYESFWRDLCARHQLDWLDLTDSFNALKTGFYPTSENCCHFHYTAYGNLLIAHLLSRYLPEQNRISLGSEKTAAPSTLLSPVTPMESYNSLVAGGDDQGFQDGSFTRARFRNPTGLAFDDGGLRLFVADFGNNRIRAVDLSENNRVETIAGTGLAGSADGPLASSTFNQPSALAWTGKESLVVWDDGNHLFRKLDLKAGKVSTLVLSSAGETKPQLPLGPVYNMAYLAGEDSLYFTEPSNGRLRKLDLKSQSVTTVFSNQPQLPHPLALCTDGNRLFVSDQDTSTVYEVQMKVAIPSSQATATLSFLGKGNQIREMAVSDGVLYALQAGTDSLVRLNPYEPINPATPWGFTLNNVNPGYEPLLLFKDQQSIGFAASAAYPRKLFVACPGFQTQSIISVRDYRFDKGWTARSNAGELLTDFDYPAHKPPKTIRLLVVGNSRVVTAPRIIPAARAGDPGFQVESRGKISLRTDTFAKQLEFLLNAQASLSGSDTHFEVLTLGHPGKAPPFFSYYEVPPLVEKYDIDLVIFPVFSEELAFQGYFEVPLTNLGIPQEKLDLEYLLKPSMEKVPDGNPKNLFEHCRKLGLVREDSKIRLTFSASTELLKTGDIEIRRDLIEMMGNPLRLLSGKLQTIKTSRGTPPQFLIVHIPSMDRPGAPIHVFEDFWKDLSDRQQLKMLDLTDAFEAFRPSFYPDSEKCCHSYYTAYGNLLVAALLSYYLPEQKWVPFEPTK